MSQKQLPARQFYQSLNDCRCKLHAFDAPFCKGKFYQTLRRNWHIDEYEPLLTRCDYVGKGCEYNLAHNREPHFEEA